MRSPPSVQGPSRSARSTSTSSPSWLSAPARARSPSSSCTATASRPRLPWALSRSRRLSERSSSTARRQLGTAGRADARLSLLEPQIGLEEGAQLHAPAVEAALERALADTDHLSGLLRGQPLDVAEGNSRAPLGRKLRQRVLEDHRGSCASACSRITSNS